MACIVTMRCLPSSIADFGSTCATRWMYCGVGRPVCSSIMPGARAMSCSAICDCCAERAWAISMLPMVNFCTMSRSARPCAGVMNSGLRTCREMEGSMGISNAPDTRRTAAHAVRRLVQDLAHHVLVIEIRRAAREGIGGTDQTACARRRSAGDVLANLTCSLGTESSGLTRRSLSGTRDTKQPVIHIALLVVVVLQRGLELTRGNTLAVLPEVLHGGRGVVHAARGCSLVECLLAFLDVELVTG